MHLLGLACSSRGDRQIPKCTRHLHPAGTRITYKNIVIFYMDPLSDLRPMFVLARESGGVNGERMTRTTTKLRTGNPQGDPVPVVRKYRTRGKILDSLPLPRALMSLWTWRVALLGPIQDPCAQRLGVVVSYTFGQGSNTLLSRNG